MSHLDLDSFDEDSSEAEGRSTKIAESNGSSCSKCVHISAIPSDGMNLNVATITQDVAATHSVRQRGFETILILTNTLDKFQGYVRRDT